MRKNDDGSPGVPLGIQSLDDENRDGAMLLFSEYGEANAVRKTVALDGLSVFRVHMRVVGEVLL